MRWQTGRRSENVEDRREAGGGGMGRGMAVTGGVGGLGLLLILVASLIFGFDPTQLLSMLGGQAVEVGPGGAGQPEAVPGDQASHPTDEAADFVSVILADTEDTWGKEFSAAGSQYAPPRLVLFTDYVQSACGTSSTATGPFYCPGDQQVYLDLGFLNDLRRLGAPGDFAVAYVIAHEVGHHVQHLQGIDAEIQRLQARVSEADANALSVMVELQADCLAGVWANHADTERQILEEGDVQEGLDAAAAVGDDRLMAASGQRVQREAFTHGSSAERVQWFTTGLKSGDMNACDTFKAAGLR